ncbi:MAG TPA: Zn-dependent hydrolase [Candidatus Dormibacteraeota bacterium]|nr:Zn-dependent hydrolase [Candidatus Dormibacteraeota bacterium]
MNRHRQVRVLFLNIVIVASLLATPRLLLAQSQEPLPAAKVRRGAPTFHKDKFDTSNIARDLDERLAKFKPVKMPFNGEGLTAREKQMIRKLVDAANELEQIYWRQSDPEGLALYRSLAKSKNFRDDKLRHFLKINGSRYDLVSENRPFVGTEPAPPGRALYPSDLTREEIEHYIKDHPEQKAALYDEHTIVRRSGKGKALEAVPYHVAFAEFLNPAARDLREAAELSDDPAFAKFLRLRADALLSDDYYASDIAWLDLPDPKVDVIMAPYESYLDNLLGIKTSYGAAVMIRNDEESKKLALYQKYVADLQDALPIDPADKPSKRGHLTPMEVMDTPFRAGDLRHGYQAVADNLPNDPRIHEAKGSKKIFFKNFMDARINEVILPIANRLMRPDQAALVSGEGYLASTLMHEIAHELGPSYARTASGQKTIREAIGPSFSALEEAKADVLGMFGLKWLADHGAVTPEKLKIDYASYVGGIFRTVRFSIAEAHGRAEMMEFNYLFEQGVIARDSTSGLYAVDWDKAPAAIEQLTRQLLEMEASGQRALVEAWFAKYAVMPDHLIEALEKVTGIPVDIEPIFSFPEVIR